MPSPRARRWAIPTAVAVVLAALVLVFVVAVRPRDGIGHDPVLTPLGSPDPVVTAAIYDFGPNALATPAGPEQLTAAVYYPTDLRGRRPLIFIQHGSHTPCSSPGDSWPCRSPHERTPSFLGYAYLADSLVLAGYIVVSVSASATIDSATSSAEGVVLNRHLALWRSWAADASGPFGDTFVGHVDLGRIGLIGHSRGGEAVAAAAAGEAGAALNAVVAGLLLLAPALPVTLDGVTPPVPVAGAPLAVTVGTCDGDVGSEGRRYARPANPDRTLLLIRGANHNGFNTVWSPGGWPDAVDDAEHLKPPDPACRASAPTRLAATGQRRIAAGIAVSFFEAAFAGRSTRGALEAWAATEPAVTVAPVSGR